MSQRVSRPSRVARPAVYLTSNAAAYIMQQAERARSSAYRLLLGPQPGALDVGFMVSSWPLRSLAKVCPACTTPQRSKARPTSGRAHPQS